MRNILLVFLLSWAISDTFGQVQFLGSPTTTVRNRGNFVSDSLFYLPKRQKLPSDSGALRYQISDSALYVWTGSQWIKAGGGSGSVLISDTASMLTPYTRGSGTVNYLPKFTGTRTFGNSSIYDDGEVKINTTGDSGFHQLQVNGRIYSNKAFMVGNPTDTGRSLAMSGSNFEIATFLQQFGTDAADIIFSRGTGTPWSKGNAAVGNDLGGISFAGYYNGKSNFSSTIGGEVISIDTTNEVVNSDIVFLQRYNSASRFESLRLEASTGNIIVKNTARLKNIDSTSTAMNVLYADANGIIKKSAAPIIASGTANRIAKFTGTTSVGNGAIADSSSTVALTISSSNDIGLGSTTPTSSLSTLAGSGAGLVIQKDVPTILLSDNVGTTGSTFLKQLNTDFFIESSSTGTINFRTDATNRLRITDQGEVIIGALSDQGSFTLQNQGGIYAGGTVAVQIAAGSAIRSTGDIYLDAGTGGSGDYIVRTGSGFGTRLQVTNGGEVYVGGGPDAGAYALQVAGAIYNTTTITTGAPTSGSAKPWRLGEAATVSPTSPNRTIRVEIDGTVYYIHAKTTND